MSDRLSKILKKTPAWTLGSLSIRTHIIEEYINNKNTIEMACDETFKQGINEIAKALSLATPYKNPTADKLAAKAALKMTISNIITIEKMRGTVKTHYDDLDGITHNMLCTLSTGQLNLIPPCHRAVLSALDGGYGVRDGNRPPIGTILRYAAFGLTIIGDWLGKPVDLDKHALPRDPAWGQLVTHWREPDPAKLLPILLAACDTHVERIALTAKEVNSGKFEFGSPFEAVYPAEILAIINLRRSLGLSTPVIDHPLMKTPYAALTLPPNTRLEPDELLEDFLKAACKLNPEAVPEGLYEAVVKTWTEY